MAQIPLQLAYKEAEQRILVAVNEGISLGVPMFLIEQILKEIGQEAARQSETQYQEAVKSYNEAVAAEQETIEKAEETNETPSA